MKETDLSSLLERLAQSGTQFILVGGLAAVAQGAPLTTFDVDIVPARDDDNIARLLGILAELHAVYRGPNLDRQIPPTASHLKGPGHNLLVTDLGPLDILGSIEDGQAFDDLLPFAIEIDLYGKKIRVLSLEKIVAFKRLSHHPKDKAALPILEAALMAKSET